jgi:hypothetical protein
LPKSHDAAIAQLTYLVISYLTGIAFNQPGNIFAHFGELLVVDDGFKDTQLYRLAISLEELEEPGPGPIIRNIIHDQDFSHRSFTSTVSSCV